MLTQTLAPLVRPTHAPAHFAGDGAGRVYIPRPSIFRALSRLQCLPRCPEGAGVGPRGRGGRVSAPSRVKRTLLREDDSYPAGRRTGAQPGVFEECKQNEGDKEEGESWGKEDGAGPMEEDLASSQEEGIASGARHLILRVLRLFKLT